MSELNRLAATWAERLAADRTKQTGTLAQRGKSQENHGQGRLIPLQRLNRRILKNNKLIPLQDIEVFFV